MSATPYRTDSLKLAFRRVIRDAGIHRLIRDGWLAPFDHWSIPWWDPDHVAAAFLREPEKWGKSAVFFHRIDDCHEFARLLSAGGHHCEVVTADTDRETQLDAFDDGKFDVVANVAILNEGFDCPSLQTVFVRDASKLPTIQMAGRGFRLDLETGKLHCNIVQSGNAKWQFTRTATPRQAYVQRDDRWLSLGNSDVVDRLARDTLRRIADIPVELPKFFSRAEQKRRRARDRRLDWRQRQEM